MDDAAERRWEREQAILGLAGGHAGSAVREGGLAALAVDPTSADRCPSWYPFSQPAPAENPEAVIHKAITLPGGRQFPVSQHGAQHVAFLQKCVGRAWRAFDLQRQMVERYQVDGPFRAILGVADTAGAILGHLGAGWPGPASLFGRPPPSSRRCCWWKISRSGRTRRASRISRRFYSPSLPIEVPAADQRIRCSRLRPGLPPSAMRPWASGLVRGRGGKTYGRARRSGYADRPRGFAASDLALQESRAAATFGVG